MSLRHLQLLPLLLLVLNETLKKTKTSNDAMYNIISTRFVLLV